ncbi:MAG: AAA family ATPase [Saprospiraceae bacterium]|nr:AAA family ATPase [Saprospiraceae bacterium]
MLIRFIVSNFLSFKETTEFNLIAGNFKIHKEHLYANNNHFNLLHASAIYGPNGAGKTNLVKAMHFARNLIIHGNTGYGSAVALPTFRLAKDCANKPSTFEFEVQVKQTTYAYMLSLDQNRIHEEGLYETKTNGEDILLFERKTDPQGKTQLAVHKRFAKTKKEQHRFEFLSEEIAPTQPLLTEMHKRRLPYFETIFNWFQHKLTIFFPTSFDVSFLLKFMLNRNFSKKVNQLIKNVGIGIQELRLQEGMFEDVFDLPEQHKRQLIENLRTAPNTNKFLVLKNPTTNKDYLVCLSTEGKLKVISLYSIHVNEKGETFEFEFEEESDGTKRLIELIPIFIGLQHDEVFVVDELERSLHPKLIRQLLKLFFQHRNATKGQLIFTTHESTLLDLEIFRQDEIWFVEKNQTGASEFYALSDFKPRYDRNIRKGYLQGRYGAIPFTARLEELNWETHTTTKSKDA